MTAKKLLHFSHGVMAFSMKAILSVAIITLSGCSLLLMGDGMFSVNGVAPGDCLLSVTTPGATVSDWNVREVNGNFTEDFVVSPSKKTYSVEMHCGGVLVRRAQVVYPQDVGVGGVFELGGEP